MGKLKVTEISTPTDTGSITIPSGVTFAPSGHIIQVKSFTLDSAVSYSGTTAVDLGLSVDITPSSTNSKIYVTGHIGAYCDTSASIPFFTIVRDDTTTIGSHEVVSGKINVHTSMYVGDVGMANENVLINIPFAYLDSPASTNSTNYAIYGRGLGSHAMYINRSAADRNQTDARVASTITAMEIAG